MSNRAPSAGLLSPLGCSKSSRPRLVARSAAAICRLICSTLARSISSAVSCFAARSAARLRSASSASSCAMRFCQWCFFDQTPSNVTLLCNLRERERMERFSSSFPSATNAAYACRLSLGSGCGSVIVPRFLAPGLTECLIYASNRTDRVFYPLHRYITYVHGVFYPLQIVFL
jgi:hypothetical protein